MTTAPAILRLDERKALLWFRKHEPAMPSLRDPAAPTYRMLARLVQAGLIQLWPGRKRYDPLIYSLTQAGLNALAHPVGMTEASS